ncbi:kinase-like protein [Fistulina hepatica ATCC 64428]|uniref:non-specific serine/threonine protein kinase n=1 Tax=Fistulina hepatica ATCC 64428 TaxID=1128425 RepID=A0A0D7ACL0_9AGAR|nr:kinase-like protein [Fistulina hepatica ATCC 64428]
MDSTLPADKLTHPLNSPENARQSDEITVLEAIYGERFKLSDPPRAWKNAPRLKEFDIKVVYLEHESRIYFILHVKFPRSYPTLSCPIFTIQHPVGLRQEQVKELSSLMVPEVERLKGSEMVHDIVEFCQEWMRVHIAPPAEVNGSLAVQMTQRTEDEERARIREAEERRELESRRETDRAIALDAEIQADVQRFREQQEQARTRARKRASSQATEMPYAASDTPIETFPQEIEMEGVVFDTVKIFHPRSECLGTIYMADPVCDDMDVTLPLELYSVTFYSSYYSTSQGRKKLKQLEMEIQRLTIVRSPNVVRTLAVKLNLPNSSAPPQLLVLSEQAPPVTLQHVLEDCTSLKEERAIHYISQALSGLNAIHAANLVHRNIQASCIALQSTSLGRSKTIKLGKVGFYTRLLDLNKSNPFNLHTPLEEHLNHTDLPESWLSPEVTSDSALVYTPRRDIHSMGVVLLQMLMGLDVTHVYSDVQSALQAYPRTPVPHFQNSPELDYFPLRAQFGSRKVSRWKEDWEELELLGKGGFGSVVKARNKIDHRVYAVKKVKLVARPSDTKIFREVTALSRVNHRFIVRYFTTWLETSEMVSAAPSDDSDNEAAGTVSGSDTGRVSTQSGSQKIVFADQGYSFDLADLDLGSGSKSSFPSIHFEKSRSNSPQTDNSDESDSEEDDMGDEFVERQTLKERIDDGLTEEEAWRLFLQIVDALVHLATLGIIHRDIKLTNIFIGTFSLCSLYDKGDCKLGDFGLATSSLAAVDPSDVSPAFVAQQEMTLEVGTRLYIAPEVQSRRRGPRDQSKVDMYSLGIVFFEMNFFFSTAAERIAVIEDLRKPDIIYPSTWQSHRTRQRQIITWLLQHDPRNRPSAPELSQSPLLPPRMEDEYFKSALQMMAAPDSPHHQALLNSLFTQLPKQSRGFLYDADVDLTDYMSLNSIVQERLESIFRLHGAVDQEPPLLMPLMKNNMSDSSYTVLLDRFGELVTLPKDLLAPFARLAVRAKLRRFKRYHISDVYKPSPIAGHPKAQKAAVFDIISPDVTYGPAAAGAELLAVANACLNGFPSLSEHYEIRVSHSKIVEIALAKVPEDHRSSILDVLRQQKSSPSQKRASLLKKGVSRAIADELEILSMIDVDIDAIMAKLGRVSLSLALSIQPAVDEIKDTVQHAVCAGVNRPIFFHPLLTGPHLSYFEDGILIEVVRRSKRMEVLAAGGRYDSLIARHSPPTKLKTEPIVAYGIQIAMEKIAMMLAAFQSSSVKSLIKEKESFGFWSPRRCDVYVVSFHKDCLKDRLEVVSYLWQHNISADIMYESGLSEVDHESYVEVCAREGILFTVAPRAPGRREQPAFKVKNILKGTEYELSRPELIGFLQHQIAEQKRIDVDTSGAPSLTDPQQIPVIKETSGMPDIQLILPPTDTKKQRKSVKQLFLDRAFEKGRQVKAAVPTIPTLAVDVPAPVFDGMVRQSGWISDDDVWRALVTGQDIHPMYAQQVREAVATRKSEGLSYIFLYAVREDKIQVLSLQ